MPRSGPLPWRARKIREWTTLDLIASYTFNLPPPASAAVPGLAKDGGKNVKMKDGKEKNVLPVSTAEYNPCGWRAWLNNTTLTLGMQNVFDSDPPFVAGAFGNNYDNIARHHQRSFLVRPAKEKILTELKRLNSGFPDQGMCVVRRTSALPRTLRGKRRNNVTTDRTDNTDTDVTQRRRESTSLIAQQIRIGRRIAFSSDRRQ